MKNCRNFTKIFLENLAQDDVHILEAPSDSCEVLFKLKASRYPQLLFEQEQQPGGGIPPQPVANIAHPMNDVEIDPHDPFGRGSDTQAPASLQRPCENLSSAPEDVIRPLPGAGPIAPGDAESHLSDDIKPVYHALISKFKKRSESWFKYDIQARP